MGNKFQQQQQSDIILDIQKKEFKKSYHIKEQELKDPNQQKSNLIIKLIKETYNFQLGQQIPLLVVQAKIVFKYMQLLFEETENGKIRTQDACKIFPQLKKIEVRDINEENFIDKCQFDKQMRPIIMRKSKLIQDFYQKKQKLLLKENELNDLISLLQDQKPDNELAKKFEIEGKEKITFVEFSSYIIKLHILKKIDERKKLRQHILNQNEEQAHQNNLQEREDDFLIEALPEEPNQEKFDDKQILLKLQKNELVSQQEAEYVYYNHLYKTQWDKIFEEIEFSSSCFSCFKKNQNNNNEKQPKKLIKSALLISVDDDFNEQIKDYLTDTELAKTIIRESNEIFTSYHKMDYDLIPKEPSDENLKTMKNTIENIYGYKKMNEKQMEELQIYF